MRHDLFSYYHQGLTNNYCANGFEKSRHIRPVAREDRLLRLLPFLVYPCLARDGLRALAFCDRSFGARKKSAAAAAGSRRPEAGGIRREQVVLWLKEVRVTIYRASVPCLRANVSNNALTHIRHRT